MSNIFDDVEKVEGGIAVAQTSKVHPNVADPLIEEEQPTTDEATTPLPPEQPVAQAQAPQETQQQMNFRILKQRLEAEERARERSEHERDELLKMLQKQQSSLPEEEELRFNDDDILEGKHLKKYERKIDKKLQELDRRQQQQIQFQEAQEAEMQLRKDLPNIDAIVSQENLATLVALNPRAKRALANTSDLYARGVLAYNMIKQAGIYQEPEIVREKQRLTQNQHKPKSAASAPGSASNEALANASLYGEPVNEQRRDQLRKEMEAAIRLR